MKTLFRCLALSLLVVFPQVGPWAATDDPASAQKDLAEIRARIGKLEKKVVQQTDSRSTAERDLREAEVAESAARSRLAALDQQLAEARTRLAALESELGERETALAAERAELARELRLAYITGQEDWLRLVLSDQDPVVTGRRLVYYRYISRARGARVESVRERLAELLVLRTAVAGETDRLNGLRKDQQARVVELGKAREQRRTAVARLDAEISSDQDKLGQLRGEAAQLAELVAELTRALADLPSGNNSAFKASKGKLNWPADGPALRKFGQAKADGRLRWDGTLIGAPAGSPVHAVHNGRVVFADWLPGMGLLTIVEHGNGYLTLYGHNRDLVKDVGDWVQAGDVLAHVGDSGGQAEAGLYFEIRKDGKPQDPRRWMR